MSNIITVLVSNRGHHLFSPNMFKGEKTKRCAFKDLAGTAKARAFEVKLLLVREGTSLVTAAGMAA